MPFPPVINVATLPGSDGFRIEGAAFNDGTGWSVTGPGDTDGDGFDDVVIGAPFYDVPDAYNAGAVRVVFGRDLQVGENVTFRQRRDELWQLPLVGEDANANVGRGVASLGDLDGDGFADFAASTATTNAIRTYGGYELHSPGAIVWGKLKADPAPVANVLVSETSPVAYRYGYSYFTDTNGEHAFGDGFHEACGGLCLGSYGEFYSGLEGGLFLGSLNQLDPDLKAPKTHEVVLSLDRQLGPDLVVPLWVNGDAPNDGAGRSSAALKDFNGDGRVDLAMGAPGNGAGGSDAGAVYIVFGQATLADRDVTGLASRPAEGLVIIGENAGDLAGEDVANCGDFNGDGFSDLIIGARRNGQGGADAGAAYVIFGRPGPGATIDLGTLGTAGFKIVGEDGGDQAGTSVSGAGDVNGDGFADIVIGAPNAGPNAGRAYVIFGRATTPGEIDLTNLAAADGFRIDAEFSNDALGRSVASAGDVNGDGYDDILVGAPFAFIYGTGGAGAAYVIYGRPTSASTVNSIGDDVLAGTASDDMIDAALGGTDSANGGAGNDGIYFGANLDDGDRADGGNGTNDQVGLEGDYWGANALLLEATMFDRLEVLAVLPGFDYDITTVDANVPSGGLLTVFAGQLGADDRLTFDGSAETNGAFRVFGGLGDDIVTTGAGDDSIYFGPDAFDPASDRIDGGEGNDELGLDGHYTITLDGTAIRNIEIILFLPGVDGDRSDYAITLADTLIEAGRTVIFEARELETGLDIDGVLESDGKLWVYGTNQVDTMIGGARDDWFLGGLGGDVLNGRAGANTYFYSQAAESSAASYDRVVGFDDGVDHLDLPFAVDGFGRSETGVRDPATMGATREAAVFTLAVRHAAVFTASGGDQIGRTFLVIDANGIEGYQADGDYLIEFIAPISPLDNVAMFN